MRKTLFLLLLLPFLLNAAEKEPVAQMELHRASQPPKIDGKLTEPAWDNASRTPPFRLFNTPLASKFNTIGYLMYDDENLYIGYAAQDPDILKWFHPSGRKFDGDVWMDDCLEIYLGNPLFPHTFFQFIVNYDGVGLDQASQYNGVSWNGIWQYAVSRNEQGWYAEFSIPLYTLEITPEQQQLRLNLCREKYVLPTELTSWSCAYGDFHHTERFGIATGIRLAPWPVVLTDFHFPEKGIWGTNAIACAVRNDSGDDWNGSITIEDFVNGEYRILTEQKIHLPRGARREITIPLQAESNRKYRLSLGIRDASGKIVRQKYHNLDIPSALVVQQHSFIAMEGEETISILQFSAPDRIRELECCLEGPVNKRFSARNLQPVLHLHLPTGELPPGDYVVSYILRNDTRTELIEKRPLKITTSPWK